MSRRAFSFSKSKTSASPFKETAKPNSGKPIKLTENKIPSPQIAISFISGLKSKLKEKYSSTTLGLKRLSESFPYELSALQFKSILKDLKFSHTEKDLKEFLKIYGRYSKTSGFTITIDSFSRCMNSSVPILSNFTPSSKSKKRISLIKTHSFSTRSSSNVLEDSMNKLNYTLPQHHIEAILPKASDTKVFLEHLLEILGNPELVVQYFFISRGCVLTCEDFYESVESLGLSQIYIDLNEIFRRLARSKEEVDKAEFFEELFKIQCKEADESSEMLEVIRNKLKKIFGNYLKAFDEIGCGSNVLTIQMLEVALKKLSVSIELGTLVSLFATYTNTGKLHFKEFKEFWTGKESVCSFKSCEEVAEKSVYCKKHLLCIAKRGEEIFLKLRMIINKEQLDKLLQEVMSDQAKKVIQVNAYELQKKDAQALREFLKAKGICKPKVSSSVKNRTIAISHSPDRKHVTKKMNK